ncbi:MAG: transglycosylase SLT domain-containing protein [Polyangiaceae bacterium]
MRSRAGKCIGALCVSCVLVAIAACSGGDDSAGQSGGDGGSKMGDGATSPDTMVSGSCDTDPLKTGLTAQQTGISVDAYDCSVLKWTAANSEPDPMIFKAIMYVESRFDNTSVACPNLPCGTPSGWTTDECGCFGVMQIVPACGGDDNKPGLLPNGQPDLEKDSSASDWANSVFNPDVNIEIGIAGVAGNRKQEKAKFSGCTEDQYTLMAVGDYNSYGSTKSCTEFNTAYDNPMLDAYEQYAAAAHYPAHPYR